MLCKDDLIFATTISGLLVSKDNGDSWQMSLKDSSNDSIFRIAAVGDDLYACGEHAKVFRSTDLGNSWKDIRLNLPKE